MPNRSASLSYAVTVNGTTYAIPIRWLIDAVISVGSYRTAVDFWIAQARLDARSETDGMLDDADAHTAVPTS